MGIQVFLYDSLADNPRLSTVRRDLRACFLHTSKKTKNPCQLQGLITFSYGEGRDAYAFISNDL